MQNENSGFTFVEIMIVFSIIIIMAMITMPLWTNHVKENEDEILRQQLLSAISFAKSEALIRHVPVTLCKSNDQRNCKGSWREGQLVFVDEDKQGLVKNRKKILNIFPSLLHGSLHWHSFHQREDYLLFMPDGFSNNNGSFWHCHGQQLMWMIAINRADRARVILPQEEMLDYEYSKCP